MPVSKIDNIHNQIFGKGKEYNLLDVYHYLMSSYGYINFEEFTSMDAGLVNELVKRINDDNKKANSTGKRGKF